MARSPSDATRFTATGPYISTNPQSAPTPTSSASLGTQIPLDQPRRPVPPNETPQQKIARLRAATAAARLGPESRFDVAVRVGRVWADRAHRFTALSLIGLTVISGVAATAGISDMLLHNRRRRNEWLAEKQAESVQALGEAWRAERGGTATEDQMLLLNREGAAQQAEEVRRSRPGIVKSTTAWLFSGLSTEEQKGGSLGAAGQVGKVVDTAVRQAGAEDAGQGHDRSVLGTVRDDVFGNSGGRESAEAMTSSRGGPLDGEVALVVNSAASTGRSWTSWITGR